ncbi:hypothetical protein TH47_03280 [Thalassospira sp. MCCC 1A02803]|nr:hypothetical protein TH47_03280 [Thalassospira sp. MCCC 1A02803]
MIRPFGFLMTENRDPAIGIAVLAQGRGCLRDTNTGVS